MHRFDWTVTIRLPIEVLALVSKKKLVLLNKFLIDEEKLCLKISHNLSVFHSDITKLLLPSVLHPD